MKNRKLRMGACLVLITSFVGLSGCSMGNSGNRNAAVGGNGDLVIPPSLREPGTRGATATRQTTSQSTASASSRKAAYSPTSKNYYIVVGTYPDQLEALDTFTRLSSIGLKGATMESRVTKSGKQLHMVRLGPYKKQEDIDKAKDNLTSTGLSKFKVVAN